VSEHCEAPRRRFIVIPNSVTCGLNLDSRRYPAAVAKNRFFVSFVSVIIQANGMLAEFPFDFSWPIGRDVHSGCRIQDFSFGTH